MDIEDRLKAQTHQRQMSTLYAQEQKLYSETRLNNQKYRSYWIFIIIAIIGAVTGTVSLVIGLLK